MIIYCPHCNQKISAESEMTNQPVQCPACEKGFVVPDPAEENTIQHSDDSPKTYHDKNIEDTLSTKSKVSSRTKAIYISTAVVLLGAIAFTASWMLKKENPSSSNTNSKQQLSTTKPNTAKLHSDEVEPEQPKQKTNKITSTKTNLPQIPMIYRDDITPAKTKLDLEDVRKKIGSWTEFNVVRKFEINEFPQLSKLGEVYEINIANSDARFPPISAILLTRETSFKSIGRSSMWLLSRNTINVKMKSGFNKEIMVLEEAPSLWVKEFHRIVEEEAKKKKTEGRKRALAYAKNIIPSHLTLPNIYLSNNLKRRKFSIKMENQKQQELIEMSNKGEWLNLLQRISKYSKFNSERDVASAIRNLAGRKWEIPVQLRSSSSKTQSSYGKNAQPRVNMGIITIPSTSDKIFSVTDKGVKKVKHISISRKEIYKNTATIKATFNGCSVYLFELEGSDGYRYTMYQKRYAYIKKQMEKANSQLLKGQISKAELSKIAERLEKEMRGNFVNAFLKDF